jgi:hypothetical protein
MGVNYNVDADFILKKDAPVEELTEALREAAGRTDCSIDYVQDNRRIFIHVGYYGSSAGIEPVEDAVQAFGEHVERPGFAQWECEGERGQFYVGPEEGKKEALSKHAVAQIHKYALDLTIADRDELLVYLIRTPLK